MAGAGSQNSPSAEAVVIVDYGMGNVRSVKNALAQLGCEALISADPEALGRAEGLILPGVGAFEAAMDNLRARGLLPMLERHRASGKPFLGICLGMQLLAESSEEKGEHQGLAWIPGRVRAIDSQGGKLQVPQVGWNTLTMKCASPLLSRVEPSTHFYFDHSYYFDAPAQYVTSSVTYGAELAASVQNGNIFGVQFHPEKSQTAGLKLLRGFLNHVRERNQC